MQQICSSISSRKNDLDLSSKPIATNRSKSVGVSDVMFVIFSIFVWEYRTQRPGTSHSKERHVTKPQTSHNTMQKTKPRYLNQKVFYWRSKLGRQKWSPYSYWHHANKQDNLSCNYAHCYVLVYISSLWTYVR